MAVQRCLTAQSYALSHATFSRLVLRPEFSKAIHILFTTVEIFLGGHCERFVVEMLFINSVITFVALQLCIRKGVVV